MFPPPKATSWTSALNRSKNERSLFFQIFLTGTVFVKIILLDTWKLRMKNYSAICTKIISLFHHKSFDALDNSPLHLIFHSLTSAATWQDGLVRVQAVSILPALYTNCNRAEKFQVLSAIRKPASLGGSNLLTRQGRSCRSSLLLLQLPPRSASLIWVCIINMLLWGWPPETTFQ